ncbi:amino acid adenylation domain-containing protein [Paenibacillus piscarius]|uniref:amino acid adenylation domain-containing protein n=1 Tax=Paenibacillus piscarius TaxID=1089681 RepID=UPI001EE820F3|nr:amino acid adenylation domain-containing protein [Paenibacillus piscarius]
MTWAKSGSRRTVSSAATLHGCFEARAALQPEHPALLAAGESLSYGELNRRANRLAHELAARGIRPNDHVGVIVNRNVNLIIALLAVLKSGAAYVPVDPAYPVSRQNYILHHSGSAAVVCEDGEVLAVPVQIRLGPAGTEGGSASYSEDNPQVSVQGRDLAYIMYTSGSTGLPKGVMIEHRSAVNLVRWVNRRLKLSSRDRGLCVTSVCFDLSVYDIFGLLAAGGTVVLCPQPQITDPGSLSRLLCEQRITFWNSVPTTFHALIRHLEEHQPEYAQLELRHVFLSGDWIPLELALTCYRPFPRAKLTALGGATEAAVWSIFYPVEEIGTDWTSIPYGRAIGQNRWYILDDSLRPVAAGETGELYIGGIGVARGYINDPIKTSQAFMPDPFCPSADGRMYRTGDLGRMKPDGNIEFLGRRDNQVKIRGFRVETKEVEKRLLEYPGIRDAAVLARSHSSGEKYLCACLTVRQPVSLAGLKQHLAEHLPAYMIPSMFIRLEQLPLNANGKVDYKQLPEGSLHNLLADTAFIPCTTPVQQAIARAWEAVLELKEIGLHHDFYEIGGSSIEAVALQSELLRRGIRLSYEELVGRSTISEQAALAEAGLTGAASVPKESGAPALNRAPSPGTPEDSSRPQPFNDLYYKSCLYNSLFPVLKVFGRELNTFLCSDMFVYCLEEAAQPSLSAACMESAATEAILEQLRLTVRYEAPPSSEGLKQRLTAGLARQSLYIVWVDTYYAPGRRDTYRKKHLAHTLLVCGYSEAADQFTVLEHSHKDALNYKERPIAAEDLLNCWQGYREHLMPEQTYTLMEFPVIQPSYTGERVSPINQLHSLYRNRREAAAEGLLALTRFRDGYTSMRSLPAEQYSMKLIAAFNTVIDAKRAEQYRLKAILPEQPAAAERYAKIIAAWLDIRSDLIRWSRGVPLPAGWRTIHGRLLEEIHSNEQELIALMCSPVIEGKEGAWP